MTVPDAGEVNVVMHHLAVQKVEATQAAAARKLVTARPQWKTGLVLFTLKPTLHCGEIAERTRFKFRRVVIRHDPILDRHFKPASKDMLTVEWP
jgi:hypothetical protein